LVESNESAARTPNDVIIARRATRRVSLTIRAHFPSFYALAALVCFPHCSGNGNGKRTRFLLTRTDWRTWPAKEATARIAREIKHVSNRRGELCEKVLRVFACEHGGVKIITRASTLIVLRHGVNRLAVRFSGRAPGLPPTGEVTPMSRGYAQ